MVFLLTFNLVAALLSGILFGQFYVAQEGFLVLIMIFVCFGNVFALLLNADVYLSRKFGKGGNDVTSSNDRNL